MPEGWGEKWAEKEALKQAAIFEKQCRDGPSLDNPQTFAAYAEYVLKQKERTGIKRSTLAQPGIRGGFTEKAYAKVILKPAKAKLKVVGD